MKIVDEKKLFVKNKAGEEIECDVILRFRDEQKKRSYVVYTDRVTNEFGQLHLYAAYREDASPDLKMHPVATKEEWKKIRLMLDDIKKTGEYKGD